MLSAKLQTLRKFNQFFQKVCFLLQDPKLIWLLLLLVPSHLWQFFIFRCLDTFEEYWSIILQNAPQI